MKFELKKLAREVTPEEVIQDIQHIAKLMSTVTIGQREYEERGKFPLSTIYSKFGTWKNALDQANLKSATTRERVEISDSELLKDLKYVASILGSSTISRNEYNKYGKFSFSTLESRFGSWIKAKEAAGLSRKPHPSYSEIDYFENLEKIWIELGRTPSFQEMRPPISKISGTSYQRKFGSWRRALECFVDFINKEPNSSYKPAPAEHPFNTNQREVQIEKQNIAIESNNSFKKKATPATKITTSNVTKSQQTRPQPKIADTHKTKRTIGDRLKVMVLIRDGNKCRLCGKEVTGKDIHFDHIFPWSKGGETVFENIQVLCAEHNLAKGNYYPDEKP